MPAARPFIGFAGGCRAAGVFARPTRMGFNPDLYCLAGRREAYLRGTGAERCAECNKESLRMHRVSSNADTPFPTRLCRTTRSILQCFFFPRSLRGFARIASSKSLAKYSAKQLAACSRFRLSHTLELLR